MLALESITYTVTFTDGSSMDEPTVRANGGFVPVCADADNLHSLIVHNDDVWIVQVIFRPGLRPIFGRLWVHNIGLDNGEASERWLRAICAGWQQTIETVSGPRNVKTLYWITRDGVFLADRDLDEVAASAGLSDRTQTDRGWS